MASALALLHPSLRDSGPAIGRAVAGWMKANAIRDHRITAALPDQVISFKLSV
ncbi:MAG: hypothetical protein WB420_03375 [Bradyrhizobium sp.]